MKYIDRVRLGAELFMDHLSPLTSSINNNSPEETAKLLAEEPFMEQSAECRRIHAGLKRLISDRFQLDGVLPSQVVSAAKSLYPPDPVQMIPVFDWAQSLRDSNKAARNRWTIALKDCCSAFAPEVGDVLRSFAEISAQRVALLPEGDTVVLSLPGALWGQVSLRFTGVSPAEVPASALFGYLFWVEADREDEGFRFRFLLDTSFSDVDYHDRLLENNDWMEFSFVCAGVQSAVLLHDYVARAEYHGFSGYNAMILCFGELLRKYFTLGQNALNGPELRLVSLAMLFFRLDMVPNAHSLNDHLPPMTLLMDNRYQLMQMVSFLNRECGKSGEQLAQLLEGASDDFTAEDSDACKKKLDRIQSTIRLMLENGDIRQITQPVLSMFREAARSYSDPAPFAAQLADMAQRVTDKLVPILSSCGFSGQFPNFRRLRNGYAEYISFLTDFVPAASSSGALLFSCSIAVAQCLAVSKDGTELVFDYPYDRFGASDFIEDRTMACRFGRICSAVQDGIRCTFPYHLIEDPKDEPLRDNAVTGLTNGLHIALLSLDHRRLPKHYHPHTPSFLKNNHIFSELFNRTLFAGLPVAAIIIWLLRAHLYGVVRTVLVTLAGLGAGLLAVVLLTGLRYRRFRRRIWIR